MLKELLEIQLLLNVKMILKDEMMWRNLWIMICILVYVETWFIKWQSLEDEFRWFSFGTRVHIRNGEETIKYNVCIKSWIGKLKFLLEIKRKMNIRIKLG